MSRNETRESVLAAILSQENFWPTEPRSLPETGLPTSFVESLILKRLSVIGLSSGRQLAKFICLPFDLIEDTLRVLRERQRVVHKGSAPLNDYTYALTEQGRDRARLDMATCSYVGPAPVPLTDYVVAAEAQTIRAEAPKRRQLEAAFKDVSVNKEIFETLGPAVNSGAGLFLYGEPGNGKTTLAKRVIRCFGQQVWIPYAIVDDGQIIKFYDPSLHVVADESDDSLDSTSYDERWVRIQRPTVIVGGELTLDSLEIRHDPISNVSEAPLQLKANCGCFLIDDFGRQRVDPTDLLNRWIVPLENRIDFLTLSTGKKIQVPFEQLIVFSTNLDPSDLVDEAFLRRIPYKIFVRDPERKEFHALFRHYARMAGCEYHPDVIDRLIAKHYLMANREMRRCHPRDLIGQIRNYCTYKDIRMEMRDEYFDVVVRSYFADAIHDQVPSSEGKPETEASTSDPKSAPKDSEPKSATDNSDKPSTKAHGQKGQSTSPIRDNMTVMVDPNRISGAKQSAPELTEVPQSTLQCTPADLGQAVKDDADPARKTATPNPSSSPATSSPAKEPHRATPSAKLSDKQTNPGNNQPKPSTSPVKAPAKAAPTSAPILDRKSVMDGKAVEQRSTSRPSSLSDRNPQSRAPKKNASNKENKSANDKAPDKGVVDTSDASKQTKLPPVIIPPAPPKPEADPSTSAAAISAKDIDMRTLNY